MRSRSAVGKFAAANWTVTTNLAAAALLVALCGCASSASTTSAPADSPAAPTLTAGPAFEGPPLQDLLGHEVSYQVKGSSPEAMTEALGGLIGGRMAFVPQTPDQPVSLEVKAMTVEELLSVLAQRGAAGLASGGQVQLQGKGVSAAQLSRLLTELLGTTVRFAADEQEPIQLELKGLTVQEALDALSRYGTVSL